MKNALMLAIFDHPIKYVLMLAIPAFWVAVVCGIVWVMRKIQK